MFFSEESDRIQADIAELEEKLTIFKQNNAKVLPDMHSVNMQALQRVETKIAAIEAGIVNSEDKRFYL